MENKTIEKIARLSTFWIPIKRIRRKLRELIKTNLLLQSKLKALLRQITYVVDSSKKICFGIISIKFETVLYQRPQHMAIALKKAGYECLYFDDSMECKQIDGIHIYYYRLLYKIPRSVAKKIYLIFPSTISLDGFIASDYVKLKKYGYKILYEYIDAFDDKICNTKEQHIIYNLLKKYKPDYFIASAMSLYDQLHSINKSIPIILNTNGVDIEAFQNLDESIPDDLYPILSNGNKIVGYYGAIAPWLDFELIDYAAERLSNYNFVFIGPDYGGALQNLNRRSNLYYLGSKKYAELPHYSKYFDVCIIPFELGKIAKATSPLKLFEYMAARKACVCTRDLEECKGYEGVLIAQDTDDFIKKIQDATELTNNLIIKDKLYKQAFLNSWEQKAKDIISLVENNI